MSLLSRFTASEYCVVCMALLFAVTCRQPLAAQCNGTITAYPYSEDFEANNGGWTTGGNSSDWAWGTPHKTIINSAGSGAKCWITGGLTQTAYNSNERSYLQTPCFDLTALNYPYLRFKLFCDTELNWDGANLQYSPDGGRTWIKIGYFGQPEDCLNSGWYNNPDVHFVSEQDGWSGPNTIGGQWRTAQIKLPFTGGGGKTVMFRFYFGAGDKYNDFDGFGVDDFFMGETPNTVSLSFDYTCVNTSDVSFTTNASPCLTNLQWNFDDVASGSANLANGLTATHHFAQPGNHTVKLTGFDDNDNTITATKAINIIVASVNVFKIIQCAGGTSQVEAVVQGSNNATYQYKWNTLPEITTANADLPAGNFLLSISGDYTCPAQVQVGITGPPPIVATIMVTQPACNQNNGSIVVITSGGTLPYRFNWQPAVSISGNAADLEQGNYSITITDKNGCTTTARTMLQPAIIPVNLGNDTSICYGQTLTLHAGNFSTYLWDDLSNQSQRTITQPGTYRVRVTTADGCAASDSIKITSDCGDVYFPTAFTPNGDLRNDVFGPAGNMALLKNYTLHVYNRFGNLIFSSTTPAQKWDGMYKNKKAAVGAYVYIATYEYNGVKKIKEGTLVLL